MDPNSKLFRPLKVGQCTIQHRFVMAPMTRYRADEGHVVKPFVVDYYAQRAAVPGTLLVSEGTLISIKAGGDFMVPGIFTQPQIEAWRQVTDAVHSKGSYIFCQLWAHGRASMNYFAEANEVKILAPSPIRCVVEDPDYNSYYGEPEEMTEQDIQDRIDEYVQAAKNAIEAGFDGIELHGANGYLIDQFLSDVSNHRTDGWGGSIEKRSRFAVAVVKAIANAIGPEKTAIKFSPFNLEQGMGMSDPIGQMTDVVMRLSPLGLAYIHFARLRMLDQDAHPADVVDNLIKLWPSNSPVFVGWRGNATWESAQEIVDNRDEDNVCVVVGRAWIANPDLPFRAQKNLPLAAPNRDTFYTNDEAGYIDYPFSEEFKQSIASQA